MASVYVCHSSCPSVRRSVAPRMIDDSLMNLETWELGNLGTWELGNLGTWELGNLGTWDLGNLGTWEL